LGPRGRHFADRVFGGASGSAVAAAFLAKGQALASLFVRQTAPLVTRVRGRRTWWPPTAGAGPVAGGGRDGRRVAGNDVGVGVGSAGAGGG